MHFFVKNDQLNNNNNNNNNGSFNTCFHTRVKYNMSTLTKFPENFKKS